MFQFPSLPLPAYVFSWEHARITTRRFPHSEIPGSAIGQHLPRAYRSRPRPSSALGAKASTVCSCSLDQKEHVVLSLWSFQGAHGPMPAVREKNRAAGSPARHGLSKLNSVRRVELDVVSRRTESPDDDLERSTSTGSAPTGVRAPVSLERR